MKDQPEFRWQCTMICLKKSTEKIVRSLGVRREAPTYAKQIRLRRINPPAFFIARHEARAIATQVGLTEFFLYLSKQIQRVFAQGMIKVLQPAGYIIGIIFWVF